MNWGSNVRPYVLVQFCRKNLQNLCILDEVTSISEATFKDCPILKEVKIGNGLEIIPRYCFENCTSLTKVTIGSAVKQINQDAFYRTDNISEIYCLATTPPTCDSEMVFSSSVYNNALLYVPNEQNSKDKYMTANVWKKFSKVLEYDYTTGVESIAVNDESQDSNAPIYDLTGRRVQNTSKGVYIKNGKKILVK